MGQAVFDKRMPKLATKLVKRFAGPLGTATITRIAKGVFDPLTNTDGAESTDDTTLDVSPLTPVTQKMVDENDAVLTGDYYTIIDGAGFTFEKTDLNALQLSYKNEGKFTLVWYKTYYAGENIAHNKCFFRKV